MAIFKIYLWETLQKLKQHNLGNQCGIMRDLPHGEEATTVGGEFFLASPHLFCL